MNAIAMRRPHAKALAAQELEEAADKRHRHEAAAHAKALAAKVLADEAYKQRRAATWKKALADKAYEQRRVAMRKKVLADEVIKRRCQPSTRIDGQPQTTCRRSRPCLCVGCRHGP